MEQRYFQWLAGENRGQIVIFDHIESDGEMVFICFKGDSRINEALVAQLNSKDLTGKMMAEIDHPNNGWQFKEEWIGRIEERYEINADGERVCVEPGNPGRKAVKLIPPRPTPPRSSSFGQIANTLPDFQHTPPPPEAPKNTIDKSDPVYILMTKAKKVDSEITMGMVVALPPKNLYELAKDSFDEGDEKFIQYIVDELTVEEIKDALKLAIREMYEGIQDEMNI